MGVMERDFGFLLSHSRVRQLGDWRLDFSWDGLRLLFQEVKAEVLHREDEFVSCQRIGMAWLGLAMGN